MRRDTHHATDERAATSTAGTDEYRAVEVAR